MPIVRWDPMSELRSMSRQMEKTFAPLWGGTTRSLLEPSPLTTSDWPPVDIYEDKEELIFRVEAPGMEQKNVEALIEDSTLTVRGARELYREDKKENYQRMESCYGSFSRSFSLPSTIDKDKIRAQMHNGVLEVHIPKREGAKGRAIPIAS